MAVKQSIDLRAVCAVAPCCYEQSLSSTSSASGSDTTGAAQYHADFTVTVHLPVLQAKETIMKCNF
jgi:hypothetical protein